MPFYLAPFEGSGIVDDPYRPQGVDGASEWAAVDLRANATLPDGYCLLWTKEGITGPDVIRLPDDNASNPDLDQTMPDSKSDEVASALDLVNSKVRGRSTRTLISGSLTDLAADLAINEVRAERDGVRRIRMGGAGVVWEEERDG